MPPFVVILPNVLSCDPINAGQRVYERRFSDSRGPDQCNRLTARKPGCEANNTGRITSVHNFHLEARQELGGRADKFFRRIRQVGFGEYDDGDDIGFTRQRQIALEPCGVEILIAGRDDKQRVDISRDELQPVTCSCGPSLEQALALQEAPRPKCYEVEHQPITHGGSGFFITRGRGEGRNHPVNADPGHVKAVAMNCHYPDRDCGGSGFRLELGVEKSVPTKIG